MTAFGIHELTGSPDDVDRDRTFVLVIGASFRPGVHIAYGIYWIGAGGIIGINRRADTDALRERLTAGAVGNILFAEDPVRNAPVLLGDLAALFPPKRGHLRVRADDAARLDPAEGRVPRPARDRRDHRVRLGEPAARR